MNRRLFLFKAAKLSALLAIAPGILASGCSESVTALLNTVVSAVQGLLKVADPNTPWSAQLQLALNALVAAEASWQNGGAVQIIESALGTVSAVLAVIPLTAVYSPLVDVLVAGIDAVLNGLYPTKGGTVGALAPNTRRGRATLKKPHVLQSRVGAFKSQWNATAETLKLSQAKI